MSPLYERYVKELSGTTEIEIAREPVMAKVLWCNVNDPETNYVHQIGHPFSADDPDQKNYAQTEMVDVTVGDNYGRPMRQKREEVTEEFQMCGYHFNKSNPFKNSPKELGNGQATLDDLEKRNNEWQAGYDAAMERILNRPMTADEKARLTDNAQTGSTEETS